MHRYNKISFLLAFALCLNANLAPAQRTKQAASPPEISAVNAAMQQFVEAGEIAVDREDVVEGRRRRYYRITGTGRRELAAETARMREVVNMADTIVPGLAT